MDNERTENTPKEPYQPIKKVFHQPPNNSLAKTKLTLALNQTENGRYNPISVNSSRSPDGLHTENQIPAPCQTKPNMNCILTSPIDLHIINQSEKRKHKIAVVRFHKIQKSASLRVQHFQTGPHNLVFPN